MANWVHKLNIKTEWQACKVGQLSLKDLSLAIIQKLAALGIDDDMDLDCIIEDFRAFAGQHGQTVDEFDEIWEQLYDWADQKLDDNWPPKKMCWIKTF